MSEEDKKTKLRILMGELEAEAITMEEFTEKAAALSKQQTTTTKASNPELLDEGEKPPTKGYGRGAGSWEE